MKVKVIQLNIWRGTLVDNALDFFRAENPDIILLQEVYDTKLPGMPKTHRLFSYLKEVLPEYNSLYGPAFTDTTKLGNIESGNAIFTKFKIADSKNTFFDEPYRVFDEQGEANFAHNPQTILRATLDASGVELNVFSVHGIWGIDGRDNERRLKMGDTIVEEIKGKKNIIMGGDFNLNPDTQVVKNIEKHAVQIFGNSLTRTFNLTYKTDEGFKTAVVDMIFISPEIKVLDKRCLDIQVSDHLPLVAELEV